MVVCAAEELTDGVVRLRRFRETDVPAVALACDDPESARFLPGLPSPYTEADAASYVAGCERLWREGSRFPYAIVDARTDEFLGAVDVRPGGGGSDVGYWIAPWARGRGAATSALRLVVEHAFEALGAEQLELETHLENVASQRVAEAAGFVRVATVEADVPFRDGSLTRVRYRRERGRER
ncbi:MAG TPA: GNAT family N-acetyltransferase [Gaiellaceae bacterium]|nr:GNAT family N-acetyltransferase [Gaiellaceae bacterium]